MKANCMPYFIFIYKLGYIKFVFINLIVINPKMDRNIVGFYTNYLVFLRAYED